MRQSPFNLIAISFLVLSVSAPIGPHGVFFAVPPAFADDGGDGGDSDGGDDGGDSDDGDDRDDRDDDDRSDGRSPSARDGNVGNFLRNIFRPRAQQTRRAPQRAPAPPPPAFAEDEIVSAGLAEADLSQLQAEGYTVIEDRTLPGFGGLVTRRLAVPQGVSLQDAVDRVRALPSGATTDFNHFYRAEDANVTPAVEPALCEGLHCGGHQMVNWPAPSAPLETCLGDVVIGMIDTGLNPDHETFAEARLTLHRLSFDTLEPSRAVHGTAVAAVLVGAPNSRSPGLLPQANLIAVDVFHRARGDERSDVYSLLEGLSYLVEQEVDVINLSLAGPGNVLLERAMAELTDAGIISVAATGNAGAKAEPQFPAAYEDVIAVTAVDRNERIYRRAVRGDHVDFAAPGVEVWTAASIRGARPKTGTSFAAPFVTGAVALLMSETDGLTVADIRSRLAETARDLGAEGHDPTFGHGLISLSGACPG